MVDCITCTIYHRFSFPAISVRSSLAFSDGFDDTKTWDDHDALDGDDVDDDVIHALNTSTPDEKRRSAHAQNRKLVTSSSTPPTSALVTKFFPQLKGKNEVFNLCCHLKPEPSLVWNLCEWGSEVFFPGAPVFLPVKISTYKNTLSVHLSLVFQRQNVKQNKTKQNKTNKGIIVVNFSFKHINRF